MLAFDGGYTVLKNLAVEIVHSKWHHENIFELLILLKTIALDKFILCMRLVLLTNATLVQMGT